MTTPKPPKPLAENIPLDRAWKTGRRIYVRCGYKSLLNSQFRALGAKWDPEVRALWVGSSKATQVVELAQEAEKRAAGIEAIKALGLWVRIPYEASDIRAHAKQLGAVYDGESKAWATPNPGAHQELQNLVSAWKVTKTKAGQAAKATEKERAAEAAPERRTRIAAEAGRTATGETATYTEISTAYMNRRSAATAARPIGDVVHLRDGRRGVITDVKIWFTDEEMASSVCWHQETHDQAHWDWRYELAIVEPTAEEMAQDEERAVAARDLAEIRQAVDDARGAMVVERDADLVGFTAVAEEQVAGRIALSFGSHMPVGDGTLTLTTDERALWQHPGYYDDYRHTEGVIRDEDIIRRLRALLERGDRTHTHEGQIPTRYQITTRSRDAAGSGAQ